MKFTNKIIFVVLMVMFSSAQAALEVFTCEPEWAALAQELGGDKVNIYSATTSMQDPHHIQARPSLIAKARRADLLACSGAELEIGWLPLLLRKAGNAKIQPGQPGYFEARKFVTMLDVPQKLDRSLGDVHADGNPHIHTNPENILRVATALAQRLAEVDEGNATYYSDRYSTFAKNWHASITRWKQQLAFLQGADIVTHHTFWTYLNHWAGMSVLATLEPIPGVAPSSSHLAKVKRQLAQKKAKVIMHVSYVNDRSSLWLSEKIDVPVLSLPATVDFQQGQTLTQWFEQIVQQLVTLK